MNTKEQIQSYIAGLPEPKSNEMLELHKAILKIMPKAKLWYLDGTNSEGKVVTNPNVGYGVYTLNYADGSSREFYRVGITANTAGISIYIMGIEDKTFLANAYGKRLGKATVTGYCIKFKKLADINIDVLEEAIRHRLEMK